MGGLCMLLCWSDGGEICMRWSVRCEQQLMGFSGSIMPPLPLLTPPPDKPDDEWPAVGTRTTTTCQQCTRLACQIFRFQFFAQMSGNSSAGQPSFCNHS